MKKVITGVKPTGSSMHLGNLMGAVLPFQKHAESTDAAIFIADLHALTSVKDGTKLREQSLELAIEYFAIFGIDTPIRIFRQSDIHQITNLMWILTNVTPYSLMLRAHSYKDFEQERDELAKNIARLEGELEMWKHIQNSSSPNERMDTHIAKGHEIKEKLQQSEINYSNLIKRYENNLNMGVFNYPILMTADILGYDIDAVPVGKDQLQHLEMARDLARNFNKAYGKDIFKEPEALIEKDVATLPGIDGRKMSKSYDNFIGVFDDEKTLKKRIMSIETGSEGIDEKKKNPDECNVFNLYRVFASAEQTAELRTKYESENIGFGYGHAKTALLEVLSEYLRPYREAREKLLQNPELVEARLAEGAKIMNARLDEKMKLVKEVVGVN